VTAGRTAARGVRGARNHLFIKEDMVRAIADIHVPALSLPERRRFGSDQFFIHQFLEGLLQCSPAIQFNQGAHGTHDLAD
jgi:hypothetical protein